jgi:hypothetical protein
MRVAAALLCLTAVVAASLMPPDTVFCGLVPEQDTFFADEVGTLSYGKTEAEFARVPCEEECLFELHNYETRKDYAQFGGEWRVKNYNATTRVATVGYTVGLDSLIDTPAVDVYVMTRHECMSTREPAQDLVFCGLTADHHETALAKEVAASTRMKTQEELATVPCGEHCTASFTHSFTYPTGGGEGAGAGDRTGRWIILERSENTVRISFKKEGAACYRPDTMPSHAAMVEAWPWPAGLAPELCTGLVELMLIPRDRCITRITYLASLAEYARAVQSEFDEPKQQQDEPEPDAVFCGLDTGQTKTALAKELDAATLMKTVRELETVPCGDACAEQIKLQTSSPIGGRWTILKYTDAVATIGYALHGMACFRDVAWPDGLCVHPVQLMLIPRDRCISWMTYLETLAEYTRTVQSQLDELDQEAKLARAEFKELSEKIATDARMRQRLLSAKIDNLQARAANETSTNQTSITLNEETDRLVDEYRHNEQLWFSERQLLDAANRRQFHTLTAVARAYGRVTQQKLQMFTRFLADADKDAKEGQKHDERNKDNVFLEPV